MGIKVGQVWLLEVVSLDAYLPCSMGCLTEGVDLELRE